MKTNLYEITFLLTVCLLSIFALTCNGNGPATCTPGNSTRTNGCDEFKRLRTTVYKNSAVHSDSGWFPLATGDTVSTDSNGEAELNFSACWSGRLFIFKDSSGNSRVRDCRRANYSSTSTLCVPNGTWYTSNCRAEFSASTGSGLVKTSGTSYSLTFLPDGREITLVIVMDGLVSVTPVTSFDPTELGQVTEASSGQFYFTMPDDALSEVAGLPPRQVIPLEELTAVARELGIVDWMIDVRNRASEDGVLPENWPPDLGGPEEEPTEPVPVTGERGFVVTMGGGFLQDPTVQEGLLRSVDWTPVQQVGAPEGGTTNAFFRDELINVVEILGYDPDLAFALFKEAGYEMEIPVTILYPAEDENLAKAAQLVVENLRGLGINAVIESVPGPELNDQMNVRIATGIQVISLTR